MTTPVDDFLNHKVASQAARKQQEVDQWKRWKSSGSPEDLAPLIKAYAPLLNQKTQLWKPPAVEPAAFKAELQQHLIRAFEKYDPSKGAALNTHVEIHLQKAKRYGNRYANLAYIPEGQSGQIGKIDKAHQELREELGRDPTHTEIADHLGMSPSMVARIQKARVKDVPASMFENDPTERGNSFEEQQLAVAQHILPQLFPNRPDMHELFHYTFGTNGYPQVLSTGELAKRMGRSASQISRMKTLMGSVLQKKLGQ